MDNTRDKVHALKAQGMNGSEIARELGITRQRVSQIISTPRVVQKRYRNRETLEMEIKAAWHVNEDLKVTAKRLGIQYGYLCFIRNRLGLRKR